MRILVIEHDPNVVESIRTALGTEHEVAVETDSISGFARAVSAEKNGIWFELVICEAHMVGIDGPDLLTALRGRRDPPIVMFVANGEASYVDMQADAMLKLPFGEEELRAVVQSLLARRAQAKTRRLRHIRGGAA